MLNDEFNRIILVEKLIENNDLFFRFLYFIIGNFFLKQRYKIDLIQFFISQIYIYIVTSSS